MTSVLIVDDQAGSVAALGVLLKEHGYEATIALHDATVLHEVASDTQLAQFVAQAPFSMAMFDCELRYITASRRWLADYGLIGRDLQGQSHYTVFPDIPERWKAVHQRALAGEVVTAAEDRFDRDDGTVRWLRWEVRPWYRNEVLGGIIMSAEDITERKQVEERLRLVVESVPNALLMLNSQGQVAMANKQCEILFGYSPQQMIGQAVERVLPDGYQSISPYNRDTHTHAWSMRTRGEEPELFAQHRDGRRIPVEVGVSPLTTSEGGFVLVSVIDITERKRADQVWRENEEKFRALVEHSMQGIVMSQGGRIVYNNPAACTMLGLTREEAVAQTLVERFAMVHPEDRVRMLDHQVRLERGEHVEEVDEIRIIRKDGALRTVQATVKSIHIQDKLVRLCMMLDITERKELEKRILQSQKMEAIGQLAGGIAHDFNNILSAIMGNVEMVGLDLEADHPVMTSINEIRRAVQRAKNLVQRILAFGRPQSQPWQPVQLQPVIDEVARLLRATLPAGVELICEIAADVPAVQTDASQIHQIILNLVTNAWHAMDGGTGRIAICLAAYQVDDAFHLAHPELSPGSYVRLSVSDTGSGMSAETIARIFDPFFSTKPVGEGAGLGLSVVHGIVRKQGGSIMVESQLGKGSTFHIYLPASVGQAPTDAVDTVPADLMVGHGERILYIDDEESLVFLVVRFLERFGYRVDGHMRVQDALTAFAADPCSYDLVITDYNMPGMSGMELAEQLLQIRGDALIVLTSGYLRPAEIAKAQALGIAEVILKPNSVEELGPLVQRLLTTRMRSSNTSAAAMVETEW